MIDDRRIFLSSRDSQAGIAAALRRAFEVQVPAPRSSDDFDALLARIH